MVFAPNMSTTGGGAGGYSTLLMHRCYTKHTKCSAWVMIDEKLPEDAPGQICAQYGLMDHINLGQSAPLREREESCLCFVFVGCIKRLFWCLVCWQNHTKDKKWGSWIIFFSWCCKIVFFSQGGTKWSNIYILVRPISTVKRGTWIYFYILVRHLHIKFK